VVVRNDEGHVTHYYGLINDITELKKAAQLTDIKNEQLIQADKMASIGILASGIAHEINNPNNFVLLNTRLFKKFWDDTQHILQDYYEQNGDFALGGIPYHKAREKISQLLSGLEMGSKRIQMIINRLKEFSGPDQKEDVREYDINKVVNNAILIAESMIHKSTNNFKAVLDEKLPMLTGYPNQLEQVVINLLNNACQSLDNKEKSITIKTCFDKEQNSIIVPVQDEGRGIEEVDLKNIFNPFYTTKRNDGGTGLGLSISYTIVKNHNGELSYESTPGKGTIATIRLPVQN
jgi:signal transduction histidine kinase